MTKMYISNMCQAGYIYKVAQTKSYPHPFIFCCLMQDEYLKFVEQFDDIDFSKFKKLHYKESRIFNHRNNYSWDGFNRMIGIKTKDTGCLQFQNGVQMNFPHTLYDALEQYYKKRLERFLNVQDKEICFIFRIRKFMKKQTVDKFYNLNKHKKIILFDQDVEFKNDYEDNEYNKIVITSKQHVLLVQHLKRIGVL